MNGELRRKDIEVLAEAYGFIREQAAPQPAAASPTPATSTSPAQAPTNQPATTQQPATAQQTTTTQQPKKIDQKTLSLLKGPSKAFLTSLYGMKLIPGVQPNATPNDQAVTAFTNVVLPYIQQQLNPTGKQS